jgi:hypothetical protein
VVLRDDGDQFVLCKIWTVHGLPALVSQCWKELK